MNLALQLTDEQVERLAADILKLHKPDADTALPAIPTEPALPEPAKARREWDASVSKKTGMVYHREAGDANDHWDLIRVREVLPGDPTMDQVEKLVRASETFLNNWTNSKNSNALKTALQPFTGKDKP